MLRGARSSRHLRRGCVGFDEDFGEDAEKPQQNHPNCTLRTAATPRLYVIKNFADSLLAEGGEDETNKETR